VTAAAEVADRSADDSSDYVVSSAAEENMMRQPLVLILQQ